MGSRTNKFENKRKNLVIIINEYDRIAPTGLLVADLLKELKLSQSFQTFCLKGFGNYKPGWYRMLRLLNMVYLHVVSFLYLFYLRFRAITAKTKICCVVTTNPPLIQITCCIYCFILRIPVIIWYQDAHPELEASLFEKYNLSIFAFCVRIIDRISFKIANSIITLDTAMKNRLLKFHPKTRKIYVIGPWATYDENSHPLRIPTAFDCLNLFYVGNYGKMHDISPLAKELNNLPPQRQKQFKITFVNHSFKAEIFLKELFKDFLGQVQFYSKTPFSKIKTMSKEFDFGIVCLKSEFSGLACPSKTYTYLSLGLPIFYVGDDPSSLPGQVCELGWGISLKADIFNQNILKDFLLLNKQAGKIFPNPREKCLELFKSAISDTYKNK